MSQRVRISQCMIVKNEEKNIRQALSWGRGFLYEQIVVDTGSTDRTVQIAEEMGAKVFHFPWIDDFAAAKNYAIGQAKGDWIAFLDADEYFTVEDVKKLCSLLAEIDKQPKARRHCVIRSALLELDDDGKVFSTTVQNRVFSNTPEIRYINKIHEKLKYSGTGRMVCLDAAKTLAVYHTGYSASVYRETGKLDRNIEMLLKAVEEEPEDYEAWCYLGESYFAAKRYEEAGEAFDQALSNTGRLAGEREMAAYFGQMRVITFQNQADVEEKLLELRERARERAVEFPDLDYWIGEWMYLNGKKVEAVRYLEAALTELEEYHGTAGLMMTGDLENVYGMLAHCCLELQNKPSAVRYGVLVLRMNRYVDAALETIVVLLRDEPGQVADPAATYDFLDKLYDFTQIRDRLFVMKAAKRMGFHSLYDLLYDGMSQEEKGWLDTRRQSSYRPGPEQMKRSYPGILCQNETDIGFVTLMEEVKAETAEDLSGRLKERLSSFQKKHAHDYQLFLQFYEKYPFWGSFNPDQGEYEVLDGRIRALKDHADDFIWLYEQLEDNRSKRTLYAILDNWLHLDMDGLTHARDEGIIYFDTDIVPSSRDEVFVDLGAYIGDSVLNYLKTYGEGYDRIYCYEVTPESIESLRRNTYFYPNIEIREKAAGNLAGVCYLKEREDKAANTAAAAGDEGDLAAEMVRLDEDIEEAIGFLKLDVEGGEQAALLGCEEHIKRDHPKLAVSVYHGYEDIWQIPRLIRGWDPAYRFYMRHYGGNLIPTEFILYAVR